MKTTKITRIEAREILDSRGNPTVETTMWAGDLKASASVPSGASTGVHEALELRDGGTRYRGKGVLKAVRHVNTKIYKAVKGTAATEQEKLDRRMLELDGTENKSHLGANAILSVSLAAARLAAKLEGKELYRYLAALYGYKVGPLPVPLFNVINGGAHANSGLDVQEFFIIPQHGPFRERLRQSAEVYQQLKKNLEAKQLSTGVGDEGGFAPHLGANEKAFTELKHAIEKAGYKVKKDFMLGVDAAASEFYDPKSDRYSLGASKKNFTSKTIYRLYRHWYDTYGLQIIEDGCAEDDFPGWRRLTAELGNKTTLVGDDLFVTNTKRLALGVSEKLANAVLIKVNQIGTLTETLATIKLANKHKYKIVVSHRSGETNDDFIADLAVAVRADYAKMGSLSRGERLAKYNRLLAIEAQI